jgi:hypothetical protein
MQYFRLRRAFRDTEERARVVARLERLRAQLDRDIPAKDAENNLLLSTWNIRDFAKPTRQRRGGGPRLRETWFYIAEILSRFDFVAVQEVNELGEWLEVMDILGPDWDFIATDVTDTRLGGNGERLLYLFDRRKVAFRNIAGEIVLPMSMLISPVTAEISGETLFAGKQFRRTPFLTSFQSGWFKFDICTVHIYYGADSGAQLAERVEEIDRIARYLGDRADRALDEGKALILLGDFNIVHPEHETMAKLRENGFVTPASLDRPSNLDRTKYYDQIAFKTKPEVIEYIDRAPLPGLPGNSGIFEIFESVFRAEDVADYAEAVTATTQGRSMTGEALAAVYEDWKTYQISDHKPMWVRILSNSAGEYLRSLAAG